MKIRREERGGGDMQNEEGDGARDKAFLAKVVGWLRVRRWVLSWALISWLRVRTISGAGYMWRWHRSTVCS